MPRAYKTKCKRPGGNSDSEGEVNNSAHIENNGNETTNEVDTSSFSGKKRSIRSQAKINYENQSDHEEEAPDNEPFASKRSKKTSSEIPENGKGETDEETEKSISKKKKAKQNKNSENGEEILQEMEQNGKSSSKGKKKGKTSHKKEEKHDEEAEEEEYEVEKIVDQRTIKGRRQFLVRWKGYSEESDTWENEKDLNCDRLIEEFLTEQEENEPINEEKKDKNEKTTKIKKQNKNFKNQKKNKKSESKEDKNNDNDQDAENSTGSIEYEVARIIEVYFKKDKSREFLIRWKGFSAKEDTWEPEEHLNCPELINKFMEKLKKQKESDARELRINPSHTKRYTLTMHSDKRQSRRNAAKQRVTYYECDA
ncbi:myb-like protein X [Phymastichus coffea]|uniref:myb-like protein X n=1 Tax=Phymastichus coffea TaxID=108790 RepID=UPI00273B9AED|nr:myb-like protein X [Phymastichus coffea]